MVEQELVSKYAFEAACAMVSQSLVFVVPSRAWETTTSIGSGTVIQTPGGKPVILTAWHVAEDAEKGPLSLGYQLCQRGLDDVVERVFRAPNEVDVGVIVSKPEAGAVLLEFARLLGAVAGGLDGAVTRDTAFVLGGYPASFEAKRDDHDQKIHFQLFASATFDCMVTGTDARGRLQVQWEERTMAPPAGLPSPFDRLLERTCEHRDSYFVRME